MSEALLLGVFFWVVFFLCCFFLYGWPISYKMLCISTFVPKSFKLLIGPYFFVPQRIKDSVFFPAVCTKLTFFLVWAICLYFSRKLCLAPQSGCRRLIILCPQSVVTSIMSTNCYVFGVVLCVFVYKINANTFVLTGLPNGEVLPDIKICQDKRRNRSLFCDTYCLCQFSSATSVLTCLLWTHSHSP